MKPKYLLAATALGGLVGIGFNTAIALEPPPLDDFPKDCLSGTDLVVASSLQTVRQLTNGLNLSIEDPCKLEVGSREVSHVIGIPISIPFRSQLTPESLGEWLGGMGLLTFDPESKEPSNLPAWQPKPRGKNNENTEN